MGQSFEPNNDFERQLFAWRSGNLPEQDFFAGLMEAQMVVLTDKIPEGPTLGDTQLLFLAAKDADPALAIFTSAQRATNILSQFNDFKFALEAAFPEVLNLVPEGYGIECNPGTEMGFAIEPKMLSSLKEAVGKYKDGAGGNFSPQNHLEQCLVSWRSGEMDPSDLFEVLVASEIFVLFDRMQDGRLLEDSRPLVLAPAEDAPGMLAVFSSPERVQPIIQQFSDFQHLITANCKEVLTNLIPPGIGLVCNPGWAEGFMVPSAGVDEMKQNL